MLVYCLYLSYPTIIHKSVFNYKTKKYELRPLIKIDGIDKIDKIDKIDWICNSFVHSTIQFEEWNTSFEKCILSNNSNSPNDIESSNGSFSSYRLDERNHNISSRLPKHNMCWSMFNALSVCNKADIIHQLIIDSKSSIVAITETWLTNNDSSIPLQLTTTN